MAANKCKPRQEVLLILALEAVPAWTVLGGYEFPGGWEQEYMRGEIRAEARQGWLADLRCGTQSDNALGSAQIYATDVSGNFSKA